MSNFDSTKRGSSAVFLLQQIQKKAVHPDQLTNHLKKVCVRYLLQERNHSMQEIAAIMNLSLSCVYKYRSIIKEQNVFMLDELDERKVATDLITAAETASTRLFRKGREKDAWAVLVDSVEILQSLGYIQKKPIEIRSDNLTLAEILKYAATIEQENPGLFNGANHRHQENGARG